MNNRDLIYLDNYEFAALKLMERVTHGSDKSANYSVSNFYLQNKVLF